MYSLKAVLTVEYGKELRASLEVGDALYPYDNLVKVGASKYGGVLLLYSSLTYEEISRILKNSQLTYVRSIVGVDRCCSESYEELCRCIDEYLTLTNLRVGKIKVYERGVIKGYVRELLDRLKNVLDVRSDLKLYIVPIDYKVCLSIHQ
ncbi:MAG: hypothetical protein QW133_03560 [Sulfolobales archaeon]